jgi:hypothetical protein
MSTRNGNSPSGQARGNEHGHRSIDYLGEMSRRRVGPGASARTDDLSAGPDQTQRASPTPPR